MGRKLDSSAASGTNSPRLTVRIPQTLFDRLVIVADAENKTPSEVARDAIRLMVTARERTLNSQPQVEG